MKLGLFVCIRLAGLLATTVGLQLVATAGAGPKGLPGPAETSNSNTDATVICEGEKGWIQCKQYEQIQITNAFWGREDHVTCSKVPAGLTTERLCEANADNTAEKVQGQCKGEQACEVVASNIFFDDNSCGNVYKYLKINHECKPEEMSSPREILLAKLLQLLQ